MYRVVTCRRIGMSIVVLRGNNLEIKLGLAFRSNLAPLKSSPNEKLLGLVHMGSQVLSPKSLEVNPCNLNCQDHGSWDLPLDMGSQVLHLDYDMDAYMATFFGGEAWDLCCELGSAKS
jgi:hypothetical protein